MAIEFAEDDISHFLRDERMISGNGVKCGQNVKEKVYQGQKEAATTFIGKEALAIKLSSRGSG